MSRFLDGPAVGTDLRMRCRRAPIFLRVVIDESSGVVDILDALDDTPNPSERVHVYQRVEGTWGYAFVRPGGRYEYADYRHRADADGEQLRDATPWREWALAQAPARPKAEAFKASS